MEWTKVDGHMPLNIKDFWPLDLTQAVQGMLSFVIRKKTFSKIDMNWWNSIKLHHKDAISLGKQ